MPLWSREDLPTHPLWDPPSSLQPALCKNAPLSAPRSVIIGIPSSSFHHTELLCTYSLVFIIPPLFLLLPLFPSLPLSSPLPPQ